MNNTIFYICNTELSNPFFLYKDGDYTKAQAKAESFGRVVLNSELNEKLGHFLKDLPKCIVESKTFKTKDKYYGTVYVQWHRTQDGKGVAYQMTTHKPKTISEGYKCTKFVLIPYDVWTGKTEEKKFEDPKLKISLDLIDKADVTKIFSEPEEKPKIENKIKYRSPF